MNRPGSCVKMIAMSDTLIHHYPVEWGALAYAWSHEPVASPLVMLHGLGDSAIHTLKPRVASGPLANTATLFIDLPGFGESQYSEHHPATIPRFAADVGNLLAHLGIENANIFGHSMGGNVAIRLASDHPELVSRLVVAEPLLDPTHSVLAADIARFDEATFASRRFAMLVRATRMQANRGDIAAAAFLEPLQRTNPVAMHRAATSLINHAAVDAATTLRNLPCPRTLLIGGRTQVDLSAFDLGSTGINRIPNAGHNMYVEEENAVSYAILNSTT